MSDVMDGKDLEASEADNARRKIFIEEELPVEFLTIWRDCNIDLDFANLPELVDIAYQYWLEEERLDAEKSLGGSPTTRFITTRTQTDFDALLGADRIKLNDRTWKWLRVAAYALKQARV